MNKNKTFYRKYIVALLFLFLVVFISCKQANNMYDYGETFTNSLGMTFVKVPAGEFMMGKSDKKLPLDFIIQEQRRMNYHMQNGDPDEHPQHKVTITSPFYMSTFEVTNSQYEQFDPDHKTLRGKNGFSVADDEAVIYVSWQNAMSFCDWLSKKEDRSYRLPTEAEWEYACRAGTTTAFFTGDTLPAVYWNNMGWIWGPGQKTRYSADALYFEKYRETLTDSVKLTVGQTPPNAWGLYDMHGNVEEWCLDWYGPYVPGPQINPIGPKHGVLKVIRGGSHSTEVYYLRSANRTADLPDENANWMLGFRIVLGEMPKSSFNPSSIPQLVQQNVKQFQSNKPDNLKAENEPFFKEPAEYVKIPQDLYGTLFPEHNHCPAIAECDNGDLLAIWFSTVSEKGREMAIAGSRLRYGKTEWDSAFVFWNQPDRNNTGSALFNNNGKLYHINAWSVGATWGPLAVFMRTSSDNGQTWTDPQRILPEHTIRQQVIGADAITLHNQFVLRCDAGPGGGDGSVLYFSNDSGKSWIDPGGTIQGIHAGVVKLKDGRLLALGRGNNIKDRMPMSLSEDMGKTWTYQASPFPPISSRQRPVLMRLQEGPILFVSFAGVHRDRERYSVQTTDGQGNTIHIHGMYSALSFDEGKTWSHFRPIWSSALPDSVVSFDGVKEPAPELTGYLAAVQGKNGMIHLISSRQYYSFNLAWLKSGI